MANVKSKPSSTRGVAVAATVSAKPAPKAGTKSATKPSVSPAAAQAPDTAGVDRTAAKPLVVTTVLAPLSEDAALPSTSVLTSLAGTPIEAISLLFDANWYAAEYADVAAAGMDPIRHFFDNGAREGRKPNPYFDTNWYLETNADVVVSKMNPFLHYLLYGAREGRKSRP